MKLVNNRARTNKPHHLWCCMSCGLSTSEPFPSSLRLLFQVWSLPHTFSMSPGWRALLVGQVSRLPLMRCQCYVNVFIFFSVIRQIFFFFQFQTRSSQSVGGVWCTQVGSNSIIVTMPRYKFALWSANITAFAFLHLDPVTARFWNMYGIVKLANRGNANRRQIFYFIVCRRSIHSTTHKYCRIAFLQTLHWRIHFSSSKT